MIRFYPRKLFLFRLNRPVVIGQRCLLQAQPLTLLRNKINLLAHGVERQGRAYEEAIGAVIDVLDHLSDLCLPRARPNNLALFSWGL